MVEGQPNPCRKILLHRFPPHFTRCCIIANSSRHQIPRGTEPLNQALNPKPESKLNTQHRREKDRIQLENVAIKETQKRIEHGDNKILIFTEVPQVHKQWEVAKRGSRCVRAPHYRSSQGRTSLLACAAVLVAEVRSPNGNPNPNSQPCLWMPSMNEILVDPFKCIHTSALRGQYQVQL